MVAGPDTAVRWVSRGEAVRDSMNAQPADLAIVDSQIGTMGGIAVALDLRLEADAGRLEPCPVLLVLDRRPDVFMARRSGAEGWILKPLDPIRLRRAVSGPPGRRDLARHQLHAGPGRRPVQLMRAELAAAVRDGRVDPVHLVEESLRRIETHNGLLNAVTALRAKPALAEAAASPRQGSLAGLPVLVKDLVRCQGLVTTMGSALYADSPPDAIDDVVVARLKAAGAIVLGRTNTPAFGHAAYTSNLVYGSTRNPWNADRSPGGSSGGSAAALAAGLVPLATTSDGGGSVRIPASCCGLVGYKPTMGGIGRNVLSRWISFSTQGATGSTVADVVLEASVILGPAAGDYLSVPRRAVAFEPAASSGGPGHPQLPGRRGSGDRSRLRGGPAGSGAGWLPAEPGGLPRRPDGRGGLGEDGQRGAGPEPGALPRPLGRTGALAPGSAPFRSGSERLGIHRRPTTPP